MKSYKTKSAKIASEEGLQTGDRSIRSEIAPVTTEAGAANAKGTPGITEEEHLPNPSTVAEPAKPTASGGRFRWPTREQLIAWVPFWGIILLGAILRFWDLGAKPLHHDESLHGYFSLQLLQNLHNWAWCIGLNNPPVGYSCYTYDPLLHGPFQFHAIALVYQISQWLGVPDNGVNTTTVRIMAALLGSILIGLPYFLRDYLGKFGAWLACFLLAVSPSMVYFSRFAREAIYMECFTLLMVVAIARYVRERKGGWLMLASAGFMLSYTTSEATFLTIAIFGSFLGALIVWEIGSKFRLRERLSSQRTARFQSRICASAAVLIYSIVLGIAARLLFSWLVSVSTSEAAFPMVATFLIIAIVCGIVGVPIAWMLGSKFHLPRTYAGIAVLVYFVVLGIVAKWFFGLLEQLSAYINANQAIANTGLLNLESMTVKILPWLGILLGLLVFSILALEVYGLLQPGRHGLARHVDRRQPVLDTILTMPWTHWFFALIVSIAIFLFLFTVVFTNIAGGIGDGIWRGLYYWLEQQNVARGGQPWYYYLLLIPLYEQIGVVFAVVGIIRSLRKPSRFRLFLVYWFLGNFFIYSWAGEKMPWLMIFMTMPMLLLATVGLEPCIMACYRYSKEHFFSARLQPVSGSNPGTQPPPPPSYPRVGAGRFAWGLFGTVMAVLLLLPTLHNMYEVSYVEPADGPHEMMVYVQTTTDINTLMAQVDAVDKKDFGGKHQMRIGVTPGAEWPFAWYLHNYPNLCFNYPSGCPSWANNVPVIITGGDDYVPDSKIYAGQEYRMRSWWDEGYKLPACRQGQKPSNTCSDPNLGSGVGPLLWLSYGDTPPPHAQFNLGLTAQRIWNWWWYRQPFGSTDGSYPMALFIQHSMNVNP